MNERIQELAEKAAEFANANEYAAVERRIWNNVFRNKFAELIVQECANVCEGVTKEGEPLHLVSLGYSQNIKKHFGIEE